MLVPRHCMRPVARVPANRRERRHTPPRASLRRVGVLCCWSAVATAPLACKPAATAKGPTTSEVCITALNATDDALATAIALAPDADLPLLEEYARQWDQAAAVARANGDLCPLWPSIQAIADAVECSRCSTLIEAAKEDLGCK